MEVEVYKTKSLAALPGVFPSTGIAERPIGPKNSPSNNIWKSSDYLPMVRVSRQEEWRRMQSCIRCKMSTLSLAMI